MDGGEAGMPEPKPNLFGTIWVLILHPRSRSKQGTKNVWEF